MQNMYTEAYARINEWTIKGMALLQTRLNHNRHSEQHVFYVLADEAHSASN